MIRLPTPGRSTSEMLIGEVDIAMPDDVELIESREASTSQPFTKRCIVENKTYAHSQTIPSLDRSSHCLCVAGEVYCWWQTYGDSLGPSVTENSAGDKLTTEFDDYSALIKGPSDASENPSFDASGEMQDDNTNDSEELADLVEENEYEDEEDEEEPSLESNDILKGPLLAIAANSTAMSATVTPAYSTRMPTTCLVMGRTYRQGEVLPHSTGNCVECSCGDGGRIECSPRDCVGLRPQNAAEDDFELFDIDRDRGIEGSF